jgi:hypothetical protein
MLEKTILILGSVVGIGSGVLFYWTVDHLWLPAPIFFVVDLFGTLAGSVLVGLLSAPVAAGILVLVIDNMLATARSDQDH